MSTVTINEIPTIAQDYASGLIKRSNAPEFSYSASINSKVSLWYGVAAAMSSRLLKLR
jgi:hypothetical protein